MRCSFCGRGAGFFRREHPACREKHERAKGEAVELVRRAACKGERWPDVERRLARLLRETGGPGEEGLGVLVAEGLEAAARTVLDDDLLDEEEERRVVAFIGSLDGVRASEPRVEAVRRRLSSAGAVRMMLEGNNPLSLQSSPNLVGFRFMKSEAPIWVFENIDYYTMQKDVTYRGGSKGVSVRVARGVYFRTGAMRARRHVTESRRHTDRGRLVVTTKHVYFAGEEDGHRFRVRHDRMVQIQPFADGFELTRDRANARPEAFQGMDGWFVYNLLMNAEDLHLTSRNPVRARRA